MVETNLNIMQNLAKMQEARSCRISSADPRGKNRDYWRIAPGETITIADIEGPGCINHIWMTSFCRRITDPSTIPAKLESLASPSLDAMPVLGVNCEVPDPAYYRKVLIKITWDNQDVPSVLCPFGDFFGICNCLPGTYDSLPFKVSPGASGQNVYGAPAAMNCYFSMPFNKHAKIEIINENDLNMVLFFQIDFEYRKRPYPSDIGYFHAQWRRNKPCKGWGPELAVNAPEIHSISNLDGKNNFVFMETEGCGQFVGFNFSVFSTSGNWWGEGNDMIYIDGEEMPSIVGTGGEDVFNFAWGFPHSTWSCIGNISGSTPANVDDIPNQQNAYRFYIFDPIRFTKSIKVTMEHGHANHLADDWACTTYWYQNLNSRETVIQPVGERLPNMPKLPSLPESDNKPELSEEQKAAVEGFQKRYDIYMQEKKEELERMMEETRQAAVKAVETARKVRDSYC